MDEEDFQFLCDVCEKSFFNGQILGLHIESNHKSIVEGKKKCEFCDQSYSRNSFYEHVKTKHLNTKSFECELCSTRFYKKYLLDKHRKIVHERKKSCEIEFFAKHNLMTHISVIHENKKDFKCTSCEKRYSRKADLKKHFKQVHEMKRDFKCGTFSKTFPRIHRNKY